MNSPICFILNKVIVRDVEKLIEKIKVNKAYYEDQKVQRLIKMASNFLSERIADTVNTTMDTNTFPDTAKRASVIPIARIGDDKHIYTNYRLYLILFQKL